MPDLSALDEVRELAGEVFPRGKVGLGESRQRKAAWEETVLG
jgi:hypothetical protein